MPTHTMEAVPMAFKLAQRLRRRRERKGGMHINLHSHPEL